MLNMFASRFMWTLRPQKAPIISFRRAPNVKVSDGSVFATGFRKYVTMLAASESHWDRGDDAGD